MTKQIAEWKALIVAIQSERDEWKDCVERSQERWAKRYAAAAAQNERMRDAIKNMVDITQASQDCADGTKIHNPDGDGDETCEEGICYAPRWKEVVEIGEA